MLSFRSLVFYRRQYFWVYLGLVLAAAILTGALSVGSSVRKSLHHMAMKRIGQVEMIVDARLNPVSQKLSEKFVEGEVQSAPVLFMPGTASFGKERVGHVSIYGIDENFSLFFEDAPPIEEDHAYMSWGLAQKLKIKTGDGFVVRVRTNSLLPADLPLTGSSEGQTAIRLQVTVLQQQSSCASFSLHPSQLPAENIFLGLKQLQENSDLSGLVNLILIKGTKEEQAAETLKGKWVPADSGLILKKVDSGSSFELVSNRVFLPEEIVEKSQGAPSLTYLANSISFQDKSVPYSLVSGLSYRPETGSVFKTVPELKQNEIILNSWTAADLGAAVGDVISMRYYVDSVNGKLLEETTDFRVKGIVPTEQLDRDLMPAFPGIADEEHCRDWEPGIPMDMSKIRNKDEAYWKKYKGTPKAIISYDKGREIWGNRFGQTTSLRWPVSTSKEKIVKSLSKIGPQATGLYLRNLKKEATFSASNGIDFGMLFASMSFFIIMAALILTSLLHAFHLEKRRSEMGLMMATGFTARDVKRRFLGEGLLLSLLALVPGIPLGIFYTSQVLHFLSNIWVEAVGTSEIHLHLSPKVLIGGAVTFLVFAGLTMSLVIRKFLKQSLLNLLEQENQLPLFSPAKYRIGIMGIFLLLASVVCVLTLPIQQFVISSSLLLISVLCLSDGFLEKLRSSSYKPIRHLNSFSVRNLSRQKSRSLGAVLLMASGTYIVLFVVSQQKSLNFSVEDNQSGTGGFETFAQMSIPLRTKPDSKEGLKEFGLDEGAMKKIVSIRYHRGDDASCLNLNKAQAPQVYGLSGVDLEERFTLKGGQWDKLSIKLADGVIPVIADENTILWGLQLYGGVGSQFELKDEKGRAVKVEVVAMLKNSMLQGALIMERQFFDELYPSESGYGLFLIDHDSNEAFVEDFKDVFADYGVSCEDSRERLKNFLKIEATYLVIFQMLGGLGLILGGFGFGFLILRNVQDRQGEIATLKAIGYNNSDIYSLLLKEHFILLTWAVLGGSLCAFISWLPLMVTNEELPFLRILTILWLIFGVGLLSCVVSARFSLKTDFNKILKNE